VAAFMGTSIGNLISHVADVVFLTRQENETSGTLFVASSVLMRIKFA
jgi:hypothetical protein